MAYFDRIYPDAHFVFLQRDPRSVVSSWIKAGWLDVTSAPDTAELAMGGRPRRSTSPPGATSAAGPQLSTALKIRLDLDDIAANAALLPGRVHELTYEELITEPEPTLRELCRFAELDWTPAFAARRRRDRVLRLDEDLAEAPHRGRGRPRARVHAADRALRRLSGDQERGLPKSRSSAGTVIRMILKSSQGERFSM